ncbi:nitrogen regulation protein NR(II) [Congregibacter litoralis]|uniref:Sensory histidine kinase/phosphatase NtrB n=1 Tax=Congregibacter litoralis KT71 TaxID=314285 RepID=A4A8S0_9GAMM|nr:nitrogen regulation protein NR(II) [Congregibacter litoralis]EAQ97462.1 PAS/PAC sensor signal transduction histidine kinase [Congregibacter litoralis KT71]
MLQQDIIDNINSGIIGLDADYRVRLINPAAEALLQLSEARILGVKICELDTHDVPWRATLDQAAREGRAIVRRGLSLDTRDGKPSFADIVVSPMREVSRLAFLIEMQPVDRLLRISREENLMSAQETTRTVVRGLAHEVKNPLGGIRGAAQLLERELPKGSLQEYTNIIIQEADRLRDLVDRLLGPNKEPALVSLNIHEVLEHVLQLAVVEAGERLAVLRDYDPSLPPVKGDRGLLIQALLNIIGNALQATENQPQCALTLRSRSQRQFTIGERRHRLVCQIDIIDNGPGIPDALRDTLFVPMVSGRAEGTGLGLSISQSIVHRHGGLLSCESHPGETCFTIHLPMEN